MRGIEKEEKEKAIELEIAKLEKDKVIELEIAKFDNEEKMRDAELEKVRLEKEKIMELEKARLDMELAKTKLEKGKPDVEIGTKQVGVPKMPKMPPFEDQKDNIDAYLQRFERIAKAQSWPENQWAAYLSTLLKGKALEVYSRLDPDQAEEYNQVKEALLKRYEMTEEGFHKKFRTSKTEIGESFTQFIVRIGNYFTRWIELSGTAKTYAGVRDLLLREQILNTVGPNLSIFLKERKPKTADEMAKLAEHFVEARGTISRKPNKSFPSGNDKYRDKGLSIQNRPQTGEQKELKGFVPIKQRRCYSCGELGHISTSCNAVKSKEKGKVGIASVMIEEAVSIIAKGIDVDIGPGGADCESNSHGKMRNSGNVAASPIESEAEMTSGTMCGMCGTMPVCPGKLCGQKVNVLRDTGCSGVIVRSSLVNKDCLTDECQKCVMADGRATIVPVAWVTIDSPFYRGTVRAACMETPLFDVILGNIPGVRASDDPLPMVEEVDGVESVAAVETRRQRRKRVEGMRPMKTLKSVGMSLSRSEFMEKQRNDSSLDKVRKLIEEGTERQTAKGVSKYFADEGMLYRKYVGKEDPVIQAVVPLELKSEVMKVCHESLMAGHMGVKRTLDRVTSQFYWPGVQGDVRRHCLSCDVWQRTIPKGKVGRVPLGQMPLISTPFERIAVDLIGPLYPVTERGNRYILTVVDYATRYPEAVALPRIETEYVAEALLAIFSRVGVPKEMLSDMGSQFTSAVMKENRLEETIEVAHQTLKKASDRYRKYYNVKTKVRQMKPGDKVLVLLPTNQNKLLLQWKGPFVIEEKFGLIDVPEATVKVKHELDMPEISSPNLEAKETYLDVDISSDLTSVQQAEVRALLEEYEDVLTDLPGRTNCIEYKIRLISSDPVRSRPYPLPHHMREVVASEVQSMLDLGVIEPSDSPYASPIVLVKKPDLTYRFCVDFRRSNQITVFDSEPITLTESLFTRLSKCKFYSKIDISKAYWQIPMEEASKACTAFVTPDGLYQWTVMPFGVVNAPAVFTRLMRKVLRGIAHVDSYIDDILEGTEEWSEHMNSLRAVFSHLRQYQLTARPSKVVIGYHTLQFLGHTVGEGKISPDRKKLDKILELSRPTTKKQVRALIGLTGYYRRFIPNFSAIAAPLTDLTKKGKSNIVEWTESHEKSFKTLKDLMASAPILHLPDLDKPFLLRTDASDVGIGAVLLQEQSGEKFPIMYVSRKLLDREKAYSTIEKECLAIVWSIQKLSRFLYGREFFLETDHQPLVWMTKAKLANGRVMRWALALQTYRFFIRAVRGVENVGADLLSRCPP
ncbi:uncharacterized protein [Haliotis cracherodii]|uniref:uncharacterized protein n=1 Tax=Haliotis cracherodii TaxID=6455 RepID=UPI0039E7A9C5